MKPFLLHNNSSAARVLYKTLIYPQKESNLTMFQIKSYLFYMSFFLIAHFDPFRTNNLFFVISGSSKFFCQIVEFSKKNQMGHIGGNILVSDLASEASDNFVNFRLQML